MNVAALQKHLNDVAALAAAAGASLKVSDELFACAQALTPFADRPIADLAAFLARAKEFSDDDRPVPMPPSMKVKAPRPPKAPAASKVAKPTSAEIIERLYRLYESIAHTGLDEDSIQKELALVGELKGAAVDTAAERMNVLAAVKKAKGVEAKKALIRDAILERRGRHERVGH